MHPLIPLALTLVPELARPAFGKDAAATAVAVANAMQTATGTADPEAARGVLARDAAASESLRISLARIAASAEQQEAAAPSQTFAGAWHPAPVKGIALGAPLVSLAVLATFAAVIWAAMTRPVPPEAETMVNLLMGSLAAMASSVVAYWVGSSAGSAAKTDMLFHSQPVSPAPQSSTGAPSGV